MEPIKRLVLVPTSGWNKANECPDVEGDKRIEAAASAIESCLVNPETLTKIAFVGGYPDRNGDTLAGKYKRYYVKKYQSQFNQRYPNLIEERYGDFRQTVAFISDKSNCTVKDFSDKRLIDKVDKFFGIDEGSKELRPAFLVFIPTSYLHFLKAAMALGKFGYKGIFANSKEPVGWKRWLKESTQFVYAIYDPLWNRYIGRKLAKMADNKAKNYWQSSKTPG